ncbi:hypothetical protein ACJMK2_014373 [Sinanodonta woodiana]|uniref:Uncharacterized protein n=1 Tax=Sinanodonta woodiana TaxID=1069815 RepID=A0ABD3V3I6_SINWO
MGNCGLATVYTGMGNSVVVSHCDRDGKLWSYHIIHRDGILVLSQCAQGWEYVWSYRIIHMGWETGFIIVYTGMGNSAVLLQYTHGMANWSYYSIHRDGKQCGYITVYTGIGN